MKRMTPNATFAFYLPSENGDFLHVMATLEMAFSGMYWSKWIMKDTFLLEIMYFVSMYAK